ncbi:MAG: outer membrane protein assembly factor BamD [Candidatus Omnitrophota bacterium]|nr:outer membrane protein assembly factor BamD [Candidatus Omnitrophota bacterium]
MQKLLSILLAVFLLVVCVPEVGAFWVWTPESGKWLNPKYVVKDTPEEQFKWALELYDSGDYERTIKEFEQLIDNFPLSKLCAESRYYIGLAYEAMGKHYYAFLAYQQIIDDYPQSERIDEIIEREYKIANLFYRGEKASILGKSIPLVSSKDKALEVFQKIIENSPYGKYGDLSQYRIAIYYKDTARYNEAIKEFYKIIDNYPKSELVDDARYEIALCRGKQAAACDYKEEIIDKAIEEFENFLKDYPQSNITDDAKDKLFALKEKKAEGIFSIAKFYELQGAIDSALIYYQEIKVFFPDTSWVSKASERISNIKKGQEKRSPELVEE